METNRELAVAIEKKLINFCFDEPLFSLIGYKEFIHFDYPKYWDSRKEYKEDIEKETEFLIQQKKFLKKHGYKGFYFVADYAIRINI